MEKTLEENTVNMFVLPLIQEVFFFYVRLPKIEHSGVHRQGTNLSFSFPPLQKKGAGLPSFLAPSRSHHRAPYGLVLLPALWLHLSAQRVTIIILFGTNKKQHANTYGGDMGIMATLQDKLETYRRIIEQRLTGCGRFSG